MIKKPHECYIETLYHFKCGNCGLYWTLSDIQHRVNIENDVLCCPTCFELSFAKKCEVESDTGGKVQD